jgi:hypothetical protein
MKNKTMIMLCLIFLFCSMSIVSCQTTSDDSLIACWHFDEGNGTYVNDSTNNRYDGIINGATWTSGIKGSALYFDGIDDSVDTADFDINDNFTISIWIKPDTTSFNHTFIGKHTFDGVNILLLGYYTKNDGCGEGYSFNIRDYRNRQGSISTTWQHIVYTGKKINPTATEITVYKNARKLWSHTLNITVGNADGLPWTIGQDWDWSPSGPERTDFYQGKIDEIKIFNRVLTDQEIIKLDKPAIIDIIDNAPGFELLYVIFGIALFITWKRKK